MRARRDVVVGLTALLTAGTYYAFATDIQASLLADSVGAQGLPKAYAVVLAIFAGLLILQASLRARPESDDESGAARLDLRALGLLLFGAGYLVLVGPLGYLVSVTLLIAGVALYTGARLHGRLVAISIAGAVMLWLVFAKAFQLGLPAGSVWQRFGS